MDEIEAEIHEATVDKGNEIKVLPQCDNLRDLIQLDRNNKSLVDAKLETDRSVKIDVNDTRDVENTVDDTDQLTHSDDKMSSLEEEIETIDTTINDANDENYVNRKEDLTIETETILCDNAGEEMQEDSTPEQVSPSQSESSRATRWEALADIAAELPPSLAVDPITGQIYSFTK